MTGRRRDITFMIAFYLLGALCAAAPVSIYYKKKLEGCAEAKAVQRKYAIDVAWCEGVNKKKPDTDFILKWWCEAKIEMPDE